MISTSAKKLFMEVILFLQLPVDIRRLVYYQLNGQFTTVQPESIERLYLSDFVHTVTSPYKRNRFQKRIYKRLYKVFAPYIGIFDYSPSLVDRWLEYSIWLRYDCIVLDNLRLNHIYSGQLLGCLDWIQLDSRLRLSYFKNNMLQIWYTYKEYLRWIAVKDREVSLDYFQINLENLTFNGLAGVINELKEANLLHLVDIVLLGIEKEEEYRNHEKFEENATHQLTDPGIVNTIRNMEHMKGLRGIAVRGYSMYETLVNMHGVRDNPGRTIGYLVRNRIKKIKILQATNLGICDLTRWENLRDITLANVQDIDLNRLVLPAKCKRLTIKKTTILVWWNLWEEIEERIQNSFEMKVIGNDNSYTEVKRINTRSMDDMDKIGQCKAIVSDTFGSLNFISLSDIHQIKGNKIVVPNNLFDNKRILLHGSTMRTLNKITVV